MCYHIGFIAGDFPTEQRDTVPVQTLKTTTAVAGKESAAYSYDFGVAYQNSGDEEDKPLPLCVTPAPQYSDVDTKLYLLYTHHEVVTEQYRICSRATIVTGRKRWSCWIERNKKIKYIYYKGISLGYVLIVISKQQRIKACLDHSKIQ